MKNKTLKIVLTAFTLILGVFIWQSCDSSENFDNSLITSKKLQPYAIVSSEEEYAEALSAIKNTIDSIEKECNKKYYEKLSKYKQLVEKESNNITTIQRIKSKSEESSGTGNQQGRTSAIISYKNFELNIDMIWDKPMGNIQVASYLTGLTSRVNYTQRLLNTYWQGGATWCVPTAEVTGTINYYIHLGESKKLRTEKIEYKVIGDLIKL